LAIICEFFAAGGANGRKRGNGQAIMTMQLAGMNSLFDLSADIATLLYWRRAMIGHRRVAILAMDWLLAGDAVDEIRIAATVEQKYRLLASVDCVAEQMR
jgi:hypothetical protein